MLYSDCFMGIFDTRVTPELADSYITCAKALHQWKDHPEYGYLFASMEAICDVLSIKYALGVNTRSAYAAGDRTALAKLAEDYASVQGYIETFYEAYRKQWMLENKPCGFEIHDQRMGGLLMRVKHCQKRIEAYLAGELERIEELEETILDIEGKSGTQEAMEYNVWAYTVSANVV